MLSSFNFSMKGSSEIAQATAPEGKKPVLSPGAKLSD